MDRRQCLDAAAEAVLKNRQNLYGTPEDGFAGIAAIWSVLLGRKVASYEVALCLAALKLVRATNSPQHADNWADLAGYAACGAELATPPEQLDLPGVVTKVQAESLTRYRGNTCQGCGEEYPPQVPFCHNVDCSLSVVKRTAEVTPQELAAHMAKTPPGQWGDIPDAPPCQYCGGDDHLSQYCPASAPALKG